jgi:hypothetical protein
VRCSSCSPRYSAQATPGGESVQAVINKAETYTGMPYGTPAFADSLGGTESGSGIGDGNIDCSGLTMQAYSAVGITLPHNAEAQARYTSAYFVPPSNGKNWAMSDLSAGDLLFFIGGGGVDAGAGTVPAIGHVALYIGNGQLFEAAGQVGGAGINPVLGRLDGVGTDVVIYVTRPILMQSSLNPNTGAWTNTNENGGVDAAYRLFNILFQPSQFSSALSNTLRGDFAPANDESLLTSVAQVCAGSMRSFMSGPNGDFIAFFPDYFGINNTQAVWDIEDVEIIDLHLQINDDELVTHVYTIGDTGETDSPGQTPTSADWLASAGEVSIMSKHIMDQILNMQSNTGFLSDPTAFMQRFGLRPMQQQMSIIRSHYYEFFASLYTFLQQWAKQYSTDVKICFMPELYPGMRMNIKNHGVCVYIEGVTHTFDYQNGFATYPTISCPSSPAGGNNGLPIALGL